MVIGLSGGGRAAVQVLGGTSTLLWNVKRCSGRYLLWRQRDSSAGACMGAINTILGDVCVVFWLWGGVDSVQFPAFHILVIGLQGMQHKEVCMQWLKYGVSAVL